MVSERFCEHCSSLIIPIRNIPHQKYCSSACANAAFRVKTLALNNRAGDSKTTNGTAGAISELIVSVDLMRKGYHVFRAMSAHCPCDLIAMLGEKVLRVEVRTATVNLDESIGYPKHALATHRYDVLALVIRGTDVQYVPDLL